MYYNLNLTHRERERERESERERERTAKKVQNRIPNNRGRINDDQQKYEVELCVKSSNLCLYIYVTLFMHAFYNSVKKKKKMTARIYVQFQRKLHGQKRKEARKLEKNNNNNQKVYRQGRTQDFKLGGAGDKRNFFFSNMHPYSINKLSTKTNTQKSLFHNISRSTF